MDVGYAVPKGTHSVPYEVYGYRNQSHGIRPSTLYSTTPDKMANGNGF